MKLIKSFPLGEFLTGYVNLQIAKTQRVWGYSTLCEDGNHIVALDYDRVIPQAIIADLKYLIEDFDLTDFYLLRASSFENNYHVLSVGKVDFTVYAQVLSYLYDCLDRWFVVRSLKRRMGILRFGHKQRLMKKLCTFEDKKTGWDRLNSKVRTNPILKFLINETAPRKLHTMVTDGTPRLLGVVEGREPKPHELSKVHSHLLKIWFGANSQYWVKPYLDFGERLITENYRTRLG